jgi:anthranilate synthase component 2
MQNTDHLSCSPFQAGRYHSLVIEKDSFPLDALEIVAWTDDGLIMAARHKKYKHIQVCAHLFF